MHFCVKKSAYGRHLVTVASRELALFVEFCNLLPSLHSPKSLRYHLLFYHSMLIVRKVSFVMKNISPIYIRACMRVKICSFERNILILHRFLAF